jgi:hypothetical protein
MDSDALPNPMLQKRKLAVKILLLLLLLFSFRVAAQFIQLSAGLSFLPGFDAWHSASIPYPALLGSQLLIIFVSVLVIRKIHDGSYGANSRRSKILFWLGWLYFIFMFARFILSITIMQSHAWFGATLPAIFHMVLALFLLFLSSYEKAQIAEGENQ